MSRRCHRAIHTSLPRQPTGRLNRLRAVSYTMGVEPESRVMAAVMASPAAAPPPLKEGNVHNIPPILPHGRVFPIQIGDELFKLSGASICSDGGCRPLHTAGRVEPCRCRTS